MDLGPVRGALRIGLAVDARAGLEGGGTSQFSPRRNPYATSAWHTDNCCHPDGSGHRILSMILAYNFVEEERVMLEQDDADLATVERDLTAEEGLLRDPLYLSDEEDAMYIRNYGRYGAFQQDYLDFTDPNKKQEWEDTIVKNEGWEWYPDNKYKDKYGFIANNVTGGPHIAFSLTGQRYGLIEVSHLGRPYF